jgi:hypothetical protein
MSGTCTLRAGALALLVSTLAAGPAPVAAQTQAQAQARDDGWRVCAPEGQICRVDRRTVVRYGADGRWSSRVLQGSVDCTNESFGDPAPQVAKACEVRDFAAPVAGAATGAATGTTTAGWAFCAAEGEVCNFRGLSEVRFGTAAAYTVRNAFERVRCGVEDFGDPAYGSTKHCEVRSAAVLPAGPVRAGPATSQVATAWHYCAAEGQSCRVNGKTQVRFGDGRKYATRNVDGEVACGVAAFGDPSFGLVKHCEVLATGWLGATEAGWGRCAAEGQRCTFQGQAQVRYGTARRYVYREAWGGLDCGSVAFGSDPYPGRLKSCEIRRPRAPG